MCMDGIGDVFNMVELVDLSREIVHEDMYVKCIFMYVDEIAEVLTWLTSRTMLFPKGPWITSVLSVTWLNCLTSPAV